jgi:hypothetical protein
MLVATCMSPLFITVFPRNVGATMHSCSGHKHVCRTFYLLNCQTFPQNASSSSKVLCCREQTQSCAFDAGPELISSVIVSNLRPIKCMEVKTMASAAALNGGSGMSTHMVEPAAAPVATPASLPSLPTSVQPTDIPNNPIFTSIDDYSIDPEAANTTGVPQVMPAPPARGLNYATRACVAVAFSLAAITTLVILAWRCCCRRIESRTFALKADRNSRTTNKDLILKRQLQGLAQERYCLAGLYILHSPKKIRSDENGIVVLASHASGTNDDNDNDLDVIFHTDATVFERERAVLASPEWQPFVTAMHAALPGAHHATPLSAHGQPLPPAVVVAQGVSVRDWALARVSHPLLVAQTLFQLATLLQKVHDKGLVHRDIRPETLRWLPGKLEWVLISFGFSAVDSAPRPDDLNCVHMCSMCSKLQCLLAITPAVTHGHLAAPVPQVPSNSVLGHIYREYSTDPLHGVRCA